MFINNQVKIGNILKTYVIIFFTSVPLLVLSFDQKEMSKSEISPCIVK